MMFDYVEEIIKERFGLEGVDPDEVTAVALVLLVEELRTTNKVLRQIMLKRTDVES